MIHNGIEYGDMQLISEAYWVMKNLLKLDNGEMSSVFSQWNEVDYMGSTQLFDFS